MTQLTQRGGQHVEEPGLARVVRYTREFGQLRGRNRETDAHLEADQRRLVDVLDDRTQPQHPGRQQDGADQHRQRDQFGLRLWFEPATMPAPTIVEALNVAIVDVVVTLAVRDPPMNAYTTNGSMHV